MGTHPPHSPTSSAEAVSCQDASVILYAFSNLCRERFLSVTQVISHLQVHPEFRRGLEKRPQADRGISGAAPFVLQNRGDPVGRYPYRLRERVRRQAQRLEEFLIENFTRRHRAPSIFLHLVTS